MKIWINKCVEEERIEGFKNSIVFNINIPGKSGILTSDIRKGWYHKLGVQGVSSICGLIEDSNSFVKEFSIV